ncbi:MAG: 4Fe-4S binding protein, partial [Leptospira sp.]|nr:4Fe-4S binding protein [Leptospira sp.]
EDYHEVLRDKAKPILDFLREKFPGKKFRQGIDSLPIPEKILAREAGLGWIGKNTLLINENLGSYFFLTAILCEVDLTEEFELLQQTNKIGNNVSREDSVFSSEISKDRCGSCTACIDACPTQAIVAPYQLDAGKCISHHTIEYPEEEFPDGMETHGWVFGCDICQDVCPWNRVKAKKKGIVTREERFHPLEIWKSGEESWKNLSEGEFQNSLRKSPVHRTGYRSWLRNWKAGEKKRF